MQYVGSRFEHTIVSQLDLQIYCITRGVTIRYINILQYSVLIINKFNYILKYVVRDRVQAFVSNVILYFYLSKIMNINTILL